MRNLNDQFNQLLQKPVQHLKTVSRQVDLKRSKERNIALYTIRDLDEITYDSDYLNQVRFVVTDTYQLVLAKDGRPSKTIPQHREMLKSADCIAAGRLLISDEIPRRVIKATYTTNDYQKDSSSLLWLLTILDCNPMLIHPEFTIQMISSDESQTKPTIEALPINAQQLREFLDSIWENCCADHVTLRQQIIAADYSAQKDAIIDMPPTIITHSRVDNPSSVATNDLSTIDPTKLRRNIAALTGFLNKPRIPSVSEIAPLTSASSASSRKRPYNPALFTDTSSSVSTSSSSLNSKSSEASKKSRYVPGIYARDSSSSLDTTSSESSSELDDMELCGIQDGCDFTTLNLFGT